MIKKQSMYLFLQLYNHHFADEFESERFQIKVITSVEAFWLSSRDEIKRSLKSDTPSFKRDPKKEKAALLINAGGNVNNS